MKLADIDRVNHLVSDLDEIKRLIEVATRAEVAAYQVFVEAPGDASLKMSQDGPSTSHAQGVGVSEGFLKRLKQLALDELHAKQSKILAELGALGVETGG
ncbi:MAG: hypothetical protein BGO51_19765 [Rhodospirillales bacterium 69-11]|nr:hypothetical protein [Rhodospirillales bacterium]MBN8907964.1 hypothetical protein [Rhodospirillales bacterium]MBN8928696.1 hypothetical protein [Rhodospirillales bacterium]OJW28705.1 MAG: hypothetical protein BGO51_19765 [Rhodospirillales bacterium 69-11]